MTCVDFPSQKRLPLHSKLRIALGLALTCYKNISGDRNIKVLEQNSPLRPAIEIMEGVGGVVWRADTDRWLQKGEGDGE